MDWVKYLYTSYIESAPLHFMYSQTSFIISFFQFVWNGIHVQHTIQGRLVLFFNVLLRFGVRNGICI